MPREEWPGCDFCGARSIGYQEIRRGRSNLQTAQFIYCCRDHIEAARKAANPKADD